MSASCTADRWPALRVRDGLAHELDGFVWASRAAIASNRLPTGGIVTTGD
jgi:hypothetical protein